MAVFRLKLLKEASEFVDAQSRPVANKIFYNITRIANGERDAELFKKLEGTDIWEFRTLYDKKAYRLFAFWDRDLETLVVATHGIVKKSPKTPRKDIAKAEAIRKEYLEDKKKG